MRASHKRFLMSAVVPIALLGSMAAQCGPNNADPSNTTTGSTATTAPTAATGSTATAAPTGTTAPTATAAPTGNPGPIKTLSSDELTKALLTKADVPGATTVNSAPAGGDSKTVADKPACQPVLDLIDAMNAATKPTAAVKAGFKTGANGGVIVQLNQFAAGQGEKALSSAAAALGACSSIPGSVPGNGNEKVTISVSKLSAPTLGDAALAFKLSFTGESAGEYSYVFVRSGDVVIDISNLASGSVPQPDQGMVKKQVEQVKAAQQH
ncbi:hypothetical protein PUR71_13015 [Streptomyces sp. SP17BM10]|uniref:hypothetical protein n=1 Tax=Streptomyces sp. SP17BM10 TaxID=3002530 RepID=UPI002E766DAA|nr:hypothetical protein [Streptomyces sp. SP17BM10]MEE1783821.1 hypothetical protein [Streptomyces sp. SP17BM10]